MDILGIILYVIFYILGSWFVFIIGSTLHRLVFRTPTNKELQEQVRLLWLELRKREMGQ